VLLLDELEDEDQHLVDAKVRRIVQQRAALDVGQMEMGKMDQINKMMKMGKMNKMKKMKKMGQMEKTTNRHQSR
jgi:hypothetical protein